MEKEEEERLNFLIRRPFQGEVKDLSILQRALKRFPYFQPLRMLYLRILYKSDSQDFSEQLKITALYSADRSLLFNYITREDVQKLATNASSEAQVKPVVTENISKDRYAFHQWLALRKRFASAETSFENGNKKFKTIERFLQNYSGSAFSQKGYASSSAASSDFRWVNEDDLMTETLARLYVDQKKYAKALKAYKILILKYPEKSGFFADKIRSIKSKIDKN